MKAILVVISILTMTPATAFQFHKIQKVNNKTGASLDFNIMDNHDFDGDRVKDRVRCSSKKYLEIRSGKTSKVIFSWNGPKREQKIDKVRSRKRVFSGCEVAQMPGGKPIVFISNFWDTLRNGRPYWRARTPQYFAYHNGKKYVMGTLKYGRNKTYQGVSRSVKCHKYPQPLVNKGYNPGLLCMYSDYAADNYNRTALFKIEQSRDKKRIIAKDVTSNILGSPWKNGAAGTNIYSMPKGAGWANNQRDGAFMMDAEFFNFRRDGLIDLMTVGQHARVRAHKMAYDPRYREGFRFSTTNLTEARRNVDPTEFIKIRSTKRFNGRHYTPCAYLSSEVGKPERDHFRCYMNNRWVRFNLPQKFNSVFRNAVMQVDRRLGLIIKTGFKNSRDQKVDLTFRVPFGKARVPAAPKPTVPKPWNNFQYNGR